MSPLFSSSFPLQFSSIQSLIHIQLHNQLQVVSMAKSHWEVTLFHSSCISFIHLLMLVLLFSFILIHTVSPCLSNGICGGCSPAPAVSCTPSSCQPGYSCGSYGCARNRARSALTKNINGLFLDEKNGQGKELDGSKGERNVYGIIRKRKEDEGKVEQKMDNSTLLKLTNPNFIFRQCCEERGLPDACLSKCHFNTYTKDSLQSMLLKMDACPIEAATDMQFCAAQGRDHRECCSRNGVATTLAGHKCLLFCDQTPDRITKLDYSYVPCYDRFENMKRCFFDQIRQSAEEQFGKVN